MERGLTRRTVLGTASACTLSALGGCLGGSDEDGGDRQATLPAPTIGDSSAATVTVTEFVDFACPHCRTFHREVLPRLREEYVSEGIVRFEHRDFPIPVDEAASWEAPNAARAVQDEADAEAFFEYAGLLFENQGSLGLETYEDLAGSVEVDAATVRTAAEERTYDSTVESDREYGVENDVSATPTVWVDGEPVESPDYDTVSATIESARRSGDAE